MRWFGLICILGCMLGCDRATLPKTVTRPAVRNSTSTPQQLSAEAEVADSPSAAETVSGSPAAKPEPVFRAEDSRPRHDDAKLTALGIQKLSSRRLLLYTDITLAQAAGLPELMDQVYPAWEAYYGPLPLARSGADFQITGYVMEDKERFRNAGLLPADLPPFANGRHRRSEFWMNNQKDDYYRRHLLVHEGTHCFMSVVPHVMASQNWYVEGIAEYFGTHAFEGQTATDPWRSEPRTHFGLMPYDKRLFAGMGRIEMVRDEISKGHAKSLLDVPRIHLDDFVDPQAYAWSWALCIFLDTHPRYRERFRHLENHIRPPHAFEDFSRLYAAELPELNDEWLLFSHALCYGYDIPRAVIEFKPGHALEQGHEAVVRADMGWQSGELLVEAGKTYEISATGQFTVAQKPKPWLSEPQGISLRYHDGRPLGMLLACIRQQPGSGEPGASTTMLDVLPIGSRAEITAPTSGTLYFRLNECWNELADNTGEVRVEVRPTAKAPAP